MRELIMDQRKLCKMHLRPKNEHDKTEYKRENREVKYKVREKKCVCGG